MSAFRARSVVAAFCTAASFWPPMSSAQALNDAGNTGTDPSIIACDRTECISPERAMSAFFGEIYARSTLFPDDSNLYGLESNDWAALVSVAAARREEVSDYRQRLADELCLRSAELTAQQELAAALVKNVRRVRELAGTYDKELYGQLSPEGRSRMDREIARLADHVHTVDLDYAAYFAEASVEPSAYFDWACARPARDAESGEPDPPGDESRRAKPDALPLGVYVGAECPVSTEWVRAAAEVTFEREGIVPLGWPALEEGNGWFGAYVGFECSADGGDHYGLRISLIDAMEGSLLLWHAPGDGSYWAGLGPPHRGLDYSSFVGNVVDRSVSDFLRRKFELR